MRVVFSTEIQNMSIVSLGFYVRHHLFPGLAEPYEWSFGSWDDVPNSAVIGFMSNLAGAEELSTSGIALITFYPTSGHGISLVEVGLQEENDVNQCLQLILVGLSRFVGEACNEVQPGELSLPDTAERSLHRAAGQLVEWLKSDPGS